MILTIGIPTFNGASYIKETIESILSQADTVPPNSFEILVSDNCSTDDTLGIIKEYINQYGNIIRYRRNFENLGFDKNTDLVFKEAKGKFVWLLGDDDALYGESLKLIIDILDKENNISAIQVNFNKYDKQLKNIIETVEISTDLYCSDGDSFLQHSHGRWGAIASLIIKTDDWNKLELKYFHGTLIMFAYALFEIIFNKPSLIIAKPLVKVRDGSEKAVSHHNGDARINIALASGRLYKYLAKYGYNKTLINEVLKSDSRYAYDAIKIAKYWGIKNKLWAAREYIKIHNSLILWLKWIPIIFLPNLIYRTFFNIKKRVSSKTKPIEKKIKHHLRKMNAKSSNHS